MIAQQKLKKHAALFDKMAAKVGVDLEAAFERDSTLTLDELGDAVLRCAECSDPGHCEGWLSDGVANRAPSYCRNRELLDHLREA
ncbi:MAG: DUF6455 family protein [Arenibacterium sp.]